MQQVRNNPPAQVMLGDFPQAVVDAVVESGEAHESLMRRVLEDKPTAERFAQLLLALILKGANERKARASGLAACRTRLLAHPGDTPSAAARC